mmetsp:Transcript_22701/g.46524  ORF Transcript_22701/g.46524 Transcript_22701/m.46524 type:complete len:206 (-) Transcript_22701:350-967(-)
MHSVSVRCHHERAGNALTQESHVEKVQDLDSKTLERHGTWVFEQPSSIYLAVSVALSFHCFHFGGLLAMKESSLLIRISALSSRASDPSNLTAKSAWLYLFNRWSSSPWSRSATCAWSVGSSNPANKGLAATSPTVVAAREASLASIRFAITSEGTSRKTTMPLCSFPQFASLVTMPPPVDTTVRMNEETCVRTADSTFRNSSSP